MIQFSRIAILWLPVCLLCLLLNSCTNKDKVPSDVIDKDEMGNLLWDMIQADRYSGQFLIRDTAKDLKKETFRLYDEVFQLHKVSREEFIESYQFYLSRPDISKVMFDSLNARATRQRADMYKVDTAATTINEPTLVDKPAANAVPVVPVPPQALSPEFLKADSIRKAGMTKAQLRKEATIKRIDSTRRADSLKKVDAALKKLHLSKSSDSLHRKLRMNGVRHPLSPMQRDSILKRRPGLKPIPIP